MKKSSRPKSQPDSLRVDYQSRYNLLAQVSQNLETSVKEALVDTQHIDRVSFRVKGVDSFCNKAQDRDHDPPYVTPLVEIEDQIAGRVIVFFLDDIEVVESRLVSVFTPIEQQRKHPQRDSEFGYQSNHVVCLIPPTLVPEEWADLKEPPKTFEVQIRTIFMHAWAEPQHDLGYKGPDLESSVRRELAWVAASAWGADQTFQRVMKRMNGS